MRGPDDTQEALFSYVAMERRIPDDHPLRPLRALVDEVFDRLGPDFESLYSSTGRPSIPPEQLLRALLLQMVYTIRSERQLVEQIDYNLLYRWFVGLKMDDDVWSPTTFTKNRERLLSGKISERFFQEVLILAARRRLMSNEHFTVDGTLVEAWASLKSFQRKGVRRPKDRNGLAVAVELTKATGRAERESAIRMIEKLDRRRKRITLGADKGLADLRALEVTPHLAKNDFMNSPLDERTMRHPGYKRSQRTRKKVEEIFGWLKNFGLMRRPMLRGLNRVGPAFTFRRCPDGASAPAGVALYNLIRIRNLSYA